jgi:hypothetical protein
MGESAAARAEKSPLDTLSNIKNDRHGGAGLSKIAQTGTGTRMLRFGLVWVDSLCRFNPKSRLTPGLD